MKNKSQASMEYLILIGFITFIIIGVLVLAFFYSSSMKDRIRMTQLTNFANKITSTAESVFYAGNPSKATITVYFPEGLQDIEIIGDSLVVSIQTSNGLNKIAFSSNVPISGSLDKNPGLKKIQIKAEISQVVISQI